MDILLAYPYYADETFYQLIFDWHLGIGYVCAALKAKRISAGIFIHQGPISLDDTVKKILKRDPKVVGFSCHDVNYYFIKLIARELKKRKKNIVVIIGGPSATFSDKRILKDEPAIDLCVRGEGELTTIALMRALKAGDDLKWIPGITYRKNHSIARNEDRPLCATAGKDCDLDMHPSPYISGVFLPGINRGILTSRGCVYQCSYCNFAAMSQWTVRYHSAQRVVDELKCIAGNVPGQAVYLYDDNFTLDTRRAKEICRRIIDEKIQLEFYCLSRPDSIDEELLRLMKNAHFRRIGVGLESANPKTLRIINKVAVRGQSSNNLAPEKAYIRKIKTLSRAMANIGIDLELSIITGMPDETQRDAEQTVRFADRLHPVQCYHNYLVLYPGTPLFRLRKKFNLDIIAAKTRLPFKTRFSFDVSKVKLSDFALKNYQLMDIITQIAVEMLTRTFYRSARYPYIREIFFQNKFKGVYAYLVDKGLEDKLMLSSIFMVMCESNSNIKREFYRLIEKGIPLINLLILRKFDDHLAVSRNHNSLTSYGLEFLTEVVERRRLPYKKISRFIFTPISALNKERCTEINNLQYNEYSRKIIMLTLNSREDKIKFADFVSAPDSIKHFLQMCQGCFYLSNACQWINEVCPCLATEGSVCVNKNGGISLCNKDVSFGMPQCKERVADISSLEYRQALSKEIEKRRGCGVCPINRSCSKCAYPYPFSEQEFCQLRRKVDTAKFIKLLTTYNALKGSERYWVVPV